MENPSVEKKKPKPFKKFILWSIAILFGVLLLSGIYVYRNFKNLLSEALMTSFNSSIISDVYELKFEKLRLNIFDGDIKVLNVVFQPRAVPLKNYPYINSSFTLKTKKIVLDKVQLKKLITEGKLELSKIEILKPEIELRLHGENNRFLPYNDSAETKVVNSNDTAKTKKFITAFFLKDFKLVDASIHIVDVGNEREFGVKKLSFLLHNLIIDQQKGFDYIAFEKLGINVNGLSGRMKNGGFRNVLLDNYVLNVHALHIKRSIDTLIYNFKNFNTNFKNFELNTADSLFNIKVQNLDISYKNQNISIIKFSFKPNVNKNKLLKKEKYQKTLFAISVDSLFFSKVNFDSLIYHRTLIVDALNLQKVDIALFKDKSKPMDKNKFPDYLAQKIKAIPIPICINRIVASKLNLTNTERKSDGKEVQVHVMRGSLMANNITNLSNANPLSVALTAYVENKCLVNLKANFSYKKSEFSFTGKVSRFKLSDLNQLISGYAPAAIKSGVIDEITFGGIATHKNAKGNMRLLYHDLIVDLQLRDKKWQNSVLGFAANTYLNSSNPMPQKPPRIVNFSVERDMNKGGFNILLKSILAGMKETMIMSKENKQAFKNKKKSWRKKK